ncbi:MAG: NfeD family protein [Bacteroidetes bacterium]|nr:MAG: NfeD family protein [Bacteroidota bacterium]
MIANILSRPELFWFIAGLLLFLLELVIPGFFIFFFGLGAWVTALVCLIAEPGTNLQIIIFAVTSVVSLIGLRRIIQKKFFNRGTQSEEVEDEFTGKEALSTTDFGGIKNGKVEFKGTTWTAESKSEIKEGQRVTIVEKDSFKLIVEPKN